MREPDKGIYDALNKGLRLATGDIIGIVNAGDSFMHPDVVAHVVEVFKDGVDVVYDDIIMVDPRNTNRVKRTWKGGDYRRKDFEKGWMPPHVATFIRRSVFDRFGLYNTDLKIAADYELLFRFLYKHQVPAVHIPETLVRFRLGGASPSTCITRSGPESATNFRQIYWANQEVRHSWVINGFKPPRLLIPRKLFSKVLQHF